MEDFTLGIEEEYQIIDPESRELTSYMQEFLDEGRLVLQDQIKPEFLRSQVEVGSPICHSMEEARAEVIRLRRAGLIVALVAKLIKLRRGNQSWRRYRHHLITENKWRAVRYGIEGKLIDFGKQEEVPVSQLVHEILELVDDVLDELHLRKEVEYVHTILEQGTSADRQLATYEKTGSFDDVVDQLVAETLEGC